MEAKLCRNYQLNCKAVEAAAYESVLYKGTPLFSCKFVSLEREHCYLIMRSLDRFSDIEEKMTVLMGITDYIATDCGNLFYDIDNEQWNVIAKELLKELSQKWIKYLTLANIELTSESYKVLCHQLGDSVKKLTQYGLGKEFEKVVSMASETLPKKSSETLKRCLKTMLPTKKVSKYTKYEAPIIQTTVIKPLQSIWTMIGHDKKHKSFEKQKSKPNTLPFQKISQKKVANPVEDSKKSDIVQHPDKPIENVKEDSRPHKSQHLSEVTAESDKKSLWNVKKIDLVKEKSLKGKPSTTPEVPRKKLSFEVTDSACSGIIKNKESQVNKSQQSKMASIEGKGKGLLNSGLSESSLNDITNIDAKKFKKSSTNAFDILMHGSRRRIKKIKKN